MAIILDLSKKKLGEPKKIQARFFRSFLKVRAFFDVVIALSESRSVTRSEKATNGNFVLSIY